MWKYALQGTGTADEMALEERTTISTEGCVIADVAIVRPPRVPAPQQQQEAPGSDQETSVAPAEAEQQEAVQASLLV